MKKQVSKCLVFDMDGTIADLYGYNDWLMHLLNESPEPYYEAKPLYNMNELNEILHTLKSQGWRVIVTTWLSKNSSIYYDNLVRQAKLAWLDTYEFPYDEIHMIKYGSTKADSTRHYKVKQILFDDNIKVRKGWSLGEAVDATKNIIPYLKSLIK